MIILSTGTLRFFGIEKVFSIASELGFDGIELIVDERPETCDASCLRGLSERYGLPVSTLHSPFSFVKTPAWGRDPAVRMERTIRLAKAVGCESAVFHLPFFAEGRYARWLADEMPRRQEETSVKLAAENMPRAFKPLGRLGALLGVGTFYEVQGSRGIARMIRPLSRPCFLLNEWDRLLSFRYLVLDTTHLATGGLDPVEAYEKMKPRLVLIHASNFNGREHQPLRRGLLDMEGFLAHAAADGCTVPIVLEYMPEYFPDRRESTAREILSSDLALVRRYFPARGEDQG